MNKDFIKLNHNRYISLPSIALIEFGEKTETTRDASGRIISGDNHVVVIDIYLIGQNEPLTIDPFYCKDMGEYHRIKREIESFLEVSEVKLSNS